ncbi:MAG: hypothetical protein JWO62_1423 [Acidimicrobiaceae bacterium]|nr:hypothetical protein [Acidimicrobiaceae bacterium]
MSIVSNFCELTEQEQFQYLSASLPELREMETEISAQASKQADLADIVIKLNKLVGPASLHEDFVLRSNVGLASAQRYLVRLAGFLDESES